MTNRDQHEESVAFPLPEHPITRRQFVAASSAIAVTGLLPRGVAAGSRPDGPLVYVGTYTEGKRREGLHVLRMDARTGALSHVAAADVGPDPSFVALHPRLPVLYAVNELELYEGRKSGAVAAFALDGKGKVTPLGARRATGGGAPCYVSVDATGRSVFVANYAAGSIAELRVGSDGSLDAVHALVQHHGRGPNAERQEGPHAHCVIADPSNRWVLATDLGTDRIEIYRFFARSGELNTEPARYAAQLAGSGPRHLAFHPNGRLLYVIHELDQTVSAYRWNAADGKLSPIGIVRLLDGVDASATGADLHVSPSGRYVYATVRGPNVVCVLAVDAKTGALSLVQRLPSGGDWPRNFALDPSGRFVYVAHQKSNDIVGFTIDRTTGRLTPSGVKVAVPSPVCLRF